MTLLLAALASGVGCTSGTGGGNTGTGGGTTGTGGSTTTSSTSSGCITDGPCTRDSDCCGVANCYDGMCCESGYIRGGCFCGDLDAGVPGDGTSLPDCDPLEAPCNPDGGPPPDGGACMCVGVGVTTGCP